MNILAIDPGTHDSAFCLYDGTKPLECAIVSNNDILTRIGVNDYQYLACEMIQCFGMPAGAEIFETAYWIGRIMDRCGGRFRRVNRTDVKSHLCNSMKAKDPNIRQALLDRYGGSREAAIGTKNAKGPLYGISSHCWSALAIAVTFCESEKFAAQRVA